MEQRETLVDLASSHALTLVVEIRLDANVV